jgi:uncharacterized membrane protein
MDGSAVKRRVLSAASLAKPIPGSSMICHAFTPAAIAACAASCSSHATSCSSTPYATFVACCIVLGSPRLCIMMYPTPSSATCNPRNS